MLCITFTYHLPAEIYKQSPKKRSKWCLSRASKVYCGRSTATLGTAGWLQVTAWQHEFHWMLGNIREASIQHDFTNFGELRWNIYWFIILYFIILSKPMKKMQRQIIYSAKQIKTAIYWFITFQERQLTPCRGRDARHTQPFLGSCSPADFSNQVDEHPSHGHVRKKCGNRGYLSKMVNDG